MTGKLQRYWCFAALFMAYMFLHTTTLHLGSHGGAAYLSASQQELLYYAHQVFIVLGFLSFALARRFLRGQHGRSLLTAAVMGVYAVGVVFLFVGTGAYTYLYIASVTILCLGHLGGWVYWRMSSDLNMSDRMGAVMGVGCAVAYALQFPLQLWHGASPLLPVVMLAAFAGLWYFLLRSPEPETVSDQPDTDVTKQQGRVLIISLVCACVVTAALIMLVCFYDGYILQLQIKSGYGEYSAFRWPRLMLVPCYLFFGFLGDARRGKYVPLAALCAILVTLLNPILPGSEGTYWLNMCLFYVGVAAATAYYNLTFWRLAKRTRRPELWASMGRVLDGAVGVALGLLQFSDGTTSLVMAVELAALAALVVAMAVNGDLDLSIRLPVEPMSVPAPALAVADGVVEMPEPAKADIFVEMSLRYGLTRRETEVLRELVLTEDTQPVIGKRLSITANTVQGYVTQLYRKTGAATRSGLTDLYHETLNGR